MLEFKNVSKVYSGNKVAVKDINLTFNKGEFIVFIGTSGSGKTTCMRMINRMIDPTSGEILINGKNIKDINPVDLRRSIGYVIQQIGLLPHMTIYENIVLVPRLLKWSEDKQKKIAHELLKKVDLDESFLDRYPSELSGGQQQRVGVIRALAANQEIILMDEPFGALDPITRDNLQKLMKHLQQEMGKTLVFVTHDMDEALLLADRIVVMDKGQVVQFDTPDNIIQNPATEFVENLLGEDRMNQAKSANKVVDEIMIKNPVTANVDISVKDAVILMHKKRVDSLFVTDDKNILQGLIDIFTIEKYVRQNKRVIDVLNECRYIKSGTSIRDALYSIVNLGFRNLPVVDENNKLVGLVTRATLVDSIYNNIWDEPGEDVSEELEKEM